MGSVRIAALAIGCSLLASGAARAADPQRILLRDGSVVVAEVRALKDGVYVLESASLGSIQIAQDRVTSIEPQAAKSPSPPSANPAAAAQMRDLQLRLLTDPTMFAAVMRLRELPEVEAVLADPDILRAIASGDLASLEQNGKIRKLMEAPAVRDLAAQATGEPE